MKLAFSVKLHKDILTYTLDPSVINRVCVVGGNYRNEIASFYSKREVKKETKLQRVLSRCNINFDHFPK